MKGENSAQDRKRERDLRATDPRLKSANYRPRMQMLEDENETTFERGTKMHEFILPDGD